MGILEGLEPKRVFYYFEQLCGIPHGSRNTKAISDYCKSVAEGLGLEVEQDALNCLLIRKPASAGYESHPPVILQGHLDMVCQQDADCPIDMEKEGLSLVVEGDIVRAQGTTLGGDDGIAIAYALAILEDDSLPHPPIEALFTTDEETGMYGARDFDYSKLKGRVLLNIDSEEEGVLTVACAGGARSEIRFYAHKSAPTMPMYQVTFDGLIGGHSGAEIDKGRYSASVLMAKFLNGLCFDYQLASVDGGEKDNAITRSCTAYLASDGDVEAAAREFIEDHQNPADPDLFTLVRTASPRPAYSVSDSRRFAKMLSKFPFGVQKMSEDIEGLVQTSLNLGRVSTKDEVIELHHSVRSSVAAEKEDMLEKLRAIALEYGATFSSHGHYPAWEYRKDSPLRDKMTFIYQLMFRKDPQVRAIHAGLECGIFSENLPGLDAVSFGPDLEDIHTSRERMSVASVERIYRYICEVLKAL